MYTLNPKTIIDINAEELSDEELSFLLKELKNRPKCTDSKIILPELTQEMETRNDLFSEQMGIY